MAAHHPHSSSADLIAFIGSCARDIGDIDQQLPGEHRQTDALLQRQPAGRGASAAPERAPLTPTAAGSAADSAAGSAATRSIVRACILNWLRSEPLRQGCDVGADTPFAELGMDSLSSASIAAELEERVGIPILPELLFDYGSVASLAAFIDSRAATTAPM